MKIAIFPAGRDGRRLYSILKNVNDVEVKYFVDNNLNKTNEKVDQDVCIDVVSPPQIKRLMDDKLVDRILINSGWGLSYILDEMKEQLEFLEIDNYSIVPAYILRKEKLDETDYQKIFIGKKDFNQLQHLQFHVADKCNLNCRRCQHFSNIASDIAFPKFENVERDFFRLKELFNDINRIAILGGEPLLNPQLPQYCRMARQSFPYAKIDIITNGLLVRNMSRELITTVLENDILINISYYPVIELIKDDIINFLRINKMRHIIGPKINTFSKKMTLHPLQNPLDQFKKCRDRCCTTLRDGKLYPCYLPATVSIFNKQFETDIVATESCIDIYDPNLTGYKILDKLSYGFDICRYCTNEKIFPWEQTNEVLLDDWII